MTQTSDAVGSYPFSATLRASVIPSLGAGVLASGILGFFRGLDGAVSGLVGVAIAIGFFTSGLLLMEKLVKDRNPMLFLAVGMAVYFAQVMVLLGVLVVSRRVDALDSFAAGVAMLVSVLVWQVAQMVAWRRARVPVYDPQPLPRADGS